MALSRLKKKYVEEIVPDLMERLQYKSVMQVPKIKKISINQGLGAAVNDKKLVQAGVDELTLITGQKAVATKAKKSISNFKLREDMPIGAKVTLRGDMMYEFLDRLISVAIPRVRDFRGLNNKGFDGNGNYTLGVKEQIIFPEISIDKVLKVTGMDITFVTNTDSDEEALTLLTELGLPFKISKKKENNSSKKSVTAEEAPSEEAPSEEAPAEEAPTEEVQVEEAPSEEAPSEEAPSDDNTKD